jgi:hypothetical protein
VIGPAKPRRLDQPIAVSLDDLVPADHFSRHLGAVLDRLCATLVSHPSPLPPNPGIRPSFVP